MAALIPTNESDRIRALRGLNILDTSPEERFDRLTRVARRLFNVPIALVSFVDSDRQWFKSTDGLGIRETPREWSFCSHAILEEEVMFVRDATRDSRFADNPLVVEDPSIRFYAGCPVHSPDGSALGTICIIDREPRDLADDEADLLVDLAEMVETELKALELATIDPLTGLSNRRGFDSIAYHALALSERVDRPVSLLMFDLDEFKAINDSQGHEAGDRALRHFAKQLLSTFRDSDVVARLGGDEFCVLLSGAGAESARVPLTLLDRRLNGSDGTPKILYSVGIAAYDPARHATASELVREADRRMYDAKNARQS